MSTSIETVGESFVVAWNSKNPETFGALFAEDADFTDVTGRTMHGREGIKSGHARPWSTILREATLSVDSATHRTLDGGVAVVQLRWTTTGHTRPDGKPAPPRHGLLHMAVLRSGDAWQIVSACNADYTAAYKRGDADGPPLQRQ